MRTRKALNVGGHALIAAVVAAAAFGAAAEPTYNLGSPLSARDLAGWDIDVSSDGQGLPPGSGSVEQGRKLYDARCASCHGVLGEGKPADRLVGGWGTLAGPSPVRTIGSFWPYATTLYDYINRAMPLDRPQTLKPDEVYALVAYLLYLNGIAGPDAVLDARSLARVRMPNRGNFAAHDPRPDVANIPCLSDCR